MRILIVSQLLVIFKCIHQLGIGTLVLHRTTASPPIYIFQLSAKLGQAELSFTLANQSSELGSIDWGKTSTECQCISLTSRKFENMHVVCLPPAKPTAPSTLSSPPHPHQQPVGCLQLFCFAKRTTLHHATDAIRRNMCALIGRVFNICVLLPLGNRVRVLLVQISPPYAFFYQTGL